MASQTPPSPDRRPLPAVVALLPAMLALVACGCGGGTIGASVSGTTAAPPPRPAPVAKRSGSADRVAAHRGTTPATAARPVTTAPSPATRQTAATAPPARPQPTASQPAATGAAPAANGPATTPRPPAADAQPATRPLDERAVLALTRRISPAHYVQQGTVTGTYDGTMEVEARITSRGVLVRFTATLPGGTVSGHGVAVAILDSVTWPALRGTAVITGGTGRFAGVHGRGLRVSGRARPDASQAHVRLTGAVAY